MSLPAAVRPQQHLRPLKAVKAVRIEKVSYRARRRRKATLRQNATRRIRTNSGHTRLARYEAEGVDRLMDRSHRPV
jgi:hypothetical protein